MRGYSYRLVIIDEPPARWRGTISRSRYESINWDDVWRRLFLHAVTLTRGMDTVVDCGISAEDLVQRVLLKFFSSPNGLGWKESKGSLPVFLGAILTKDFIDRIRRDKKIFRPEVDQDAKTKAGAHLPTLTDEVAAVEFTDQLLKLIKGRPDEIELAEFILAGSMITQDGKVNQQLAGLLKTDENHVIGCRKRLLRVAGVKELREEFRNGRERNGIPYKGDSSIIG